MAAIDAKWEFSDAESVSASGYSENHVDLGNYSISYPQIGNLFLNCILTTGFTGCTSIDVILRTDSSTDGTDLDTDETDIMSRLTLHADRGLATTGADGLVLCSMACPLIIVSRYLQVYYTLAGASGTAVIDCYMGLHPINEQINIQESPA